MSHAVAGLDWLGYAFTPYAWLGHVLIGLGLQAVVALPLRRAGVRAGWWFGAAVSAGFWYGRKKLEFELALKAGAGLRTEAPFWWRGWLPVEWSWAHQLQFYAPAVAGLAVAWWIGRPGPRRSGAR